VSTIKNPPDGKFLNWRHCQTGEPALAAWARKAQQTFNHLRSWRTGADYVACYIGRPDEDTNGDPTNGTTSRYHVITAFPVRADAGDQDLLIRAQLWRWGFDDGGTPASPLLETWDFYKDATDVAPDVSKGYATETTAVTNDGYTDAPHGDVRRILVHVAPVSTATDEGFRMSRLDVENAMVANLSIWAVPTSSVLDLDQAIVRESDIAAGRAIMGFADGATDQKSLGALTHYIDSGDSVIHASRRCLFQQCYPIGAWAEDTAAYAHIRAESVTGGANGSTYKVKPRNLNSGVGSIVADIALCLTASDGAKIRLTSSVDSWVYTSGGDTDALITSEDGVSPNATNGILIAPGGDYIQVETLTGAGKDLLLQTISLWEPNSGLR